MMNDGKPYGLYIGGKFQPASKGRVIRVEIPKDGSHMADVAEGNEADIDRAIDAAEEHFLMIVGFPERRDAKNSMSVQKRPAGSPAGQRLIDR